MNTTSFRNLDLVPAIVQNKKKTRKAEKRFKTEFRITDQSSLNAFAKQYGITEEEKQLIDYVDLRGIGFTAIASVLGVSRQNVWQKYDNLYKRVINKLK